MATDGRRGGPDGTAGPAAIAGRAQRHPAKVQANCGWAQLAQQDGGCYVRARARVHGRARTFWSFCYANCAQEETISHFKG